jgi:hypothetical protein
MNGTKKAADFFRKKADKTHADKFRISFSRMVLFVIEKLDRCVS